MRLDNFLASGELEGKWCIVKGWEKARVAGIVSENLNFPPENPIYFVNTFLGTVFLKYANKQMFKKYELN